MPERHFSSLTIHGLLPRPTPAERRGARFLVNPAGWRLRRTARLWHRQSLRGRGGALEVTGAAGAEAVAAAGSAVITCTGVTLAAGTIGQGQSVSTLARRELSGTQDVWTQYVELSRGSDATFTFPTALDPAVI